MSRKRTVPRQPELSSRSRKRMVSLLRMLAPDEGYNLTALPTVRILRSDRALSRTPVLYDPGIVIVCQGRKRGYFGDELPEAKRMRESFTVPEAFEGAMYVSSH
jgi:hypothetical protein